MHRIEMPMKFNIIVILFTYIEFILSYLSEPFSLTSLLGGELGLAARLLTVDFLDEPARKDGNQLKVMSLLVEA